MKPLGSARHPPPYFAGRKAELAQLHESLAYLLETNDPTGGVVLVTGVPGVGKTQLGRKFAEQAVERHEGVKRFHIGTSALKSPTSLVLELGAVLNSDEAAREAADMDTRRNGGCFETSLMATRRTGMWKNCKALVLIVDELQTIAPVGMEALRVLHEGNHGCPILLVGIGLQHTRDVLASPEHGKEAISRPIAPITLGCLSNDEAVQAIALGLEKRGHVVPEESAQALAQASYGFPQHIHGYLAGAEMAIRKHGHLDSGTALDEAQHAGDQARIDYYDAMLGKLRPNREVILPVVSRMCETNRTALLHSEAVAVASADACDGEDIVAQAIAHGVLALEKGRISFAIPSFHTHMARELEAVKREMGGQLRPPQERGR